MHAQANGRQAFLSTLPPTPGERRLAIAVVLVSLLVFLVLVPFSKMPLGQLWAFIPIYESALVINDLITAVLLFGQYHILRSRALLVLASGYLFTASLAVAHALTFPGLFTPTGLLGASTQSTAWLYMFWHGGFPLFVIAYSLLKEDGRNVGSPRPNITASAQAVIAATLALACGLAALATLGHDVLPVILLNKQYTTAYVVTVSGVLLLNFISLAVVWRKQPHSVLDVWLLAVMCAWIFDISLSAILNEARFDLGFYAGRIYGLLAASFVLIVLLLENGMLHARLAMAIELERRKSADLLQISSQLETTKNELEDLYDNAPCGYHSIDENGVFLRINNTWLDWLGYKREELVGRLRHSDVMTPASARLFEEKFALFKQQGWLKDVEFEYVRKDGGVFAASLNATTIRDADGSYVMSRSTVFDITERKQAEAALRDRDQEITLKNRQLQEASRMKSEFLANMSHELRTPLNAIIGFSEAMRDGLVGELTPEQKEFATDIFNSGEHLLELINDILDLSKVEAGMMTLEPEPVDVASLLNMGLSIVREKATNRRIRLKAETEDGLRFVADLRKCKQILYNLLSNAVKFTPDGGEICVSARSVERDRLHGPIAGDMAEFRIPLPEGGADRFVEITVADTGIGMPEKDLGKLFQPFVQLDSSLGRKHQGTGLGLAMIRRLAELHGGTVGVASSEGKGTVFAVWLPLSRHEAGAAPSPLGVAAAPSAREDAPHVLVVEDNEQAATLLRTQLEAEGFSVTRARSAEEALDILARDKPDVISLDILLPGMDGWEFLERIKANPGMAEIPVVIVSIVAEKRQGFALGAAQVLQKPVTRETLVETMGRVGFRAGAGHATVLVVDDDPWAMALLTAHLEAAGYTAQRALGGGQAIGMTRHLLPDLILLDLMMPELSGFDIVEALKNDPRTAQIPIIIVTSKEITPEDRATLNGHVEFIMNKSSFSQECFVNEVWRALKRRKHRGGNGG